MQTMGVLTFIGLVGSSLGLLNYHAGLLYMALMAASVLGNLVCSVYWYRWFKQDNKETREGLILVMKI